MNRMEEESFSPTPGSPSVGERARSELQRARGEVEKFADEGRDRIADRAHNVARALERTGSNLNEENEQILARYANDAAERVRKISDYLSGHHVDDWIGEVETFARRQPAWFLGGAFALGVAASRFIKSSQSRRARAYSEADLEVPRAAEPLIGQPVVPVTAGPPMPPPIAPYPYGEGR
jgi:hypothetical protein